MPKQSKRVTHLNDCKEKLELAVLNTIAFRGLTQEQASIRAGYSASHFLHSSSRKTLPPIESMLLYLSALGCKIQITIQTPAKPKQITIDSFASPGKMTKQKESA